MLTSFNAFWSWPLAQVANLYSSVHLASLPLGDSLLEDSGIGIPTMNWEIDFSVPSDSTEIKFQFALCGQFPSLTKFILGAPKCEMRLETCHTLDEL